METKDVLSELRKKHHLTQDEMAEKTVVTRQAVSRWENGETVPSTDTLKIISKVFGVSINTLLGQPRELHCQACGMPLNDDGNISRDPDGSFNEQYCRWCRIDGKYAGAPTVEEMVEVCLPHMGWANPDDAREFLRKQLPQLEHWKQSS
jgi:transcriptional regulator with XRE-family HTH domain